MQRLDEIVDLYLQMDTNYALMITGEWGVGKTHYFKHTLKDKISATPVFKDNSKKYRPILVSLFGLKSVEEIQSEIFLCLYPILKNAKFKLGATIGKAVAKGILHLKGLGEYSKYVEEIDVNQSSLINFEELVLCFDDLERISKNLNIEEFIGYVNTLVESENVKILIIANEGKITNQNYNALKEKVVGNSIEFIPSIGDSYNSILTDKFTGFQLYKEFLETNKDFILETFSKKTTNLRTLIFALNYFQRIYSEVNNQLFNEDNLKEKQVEILLNLLKFTIAISIEYKEGRITFKKRNEIDASSEIDWSAFLSNTNSWQGNANTNTEKEKVKTEREVFIEDFYTNDKFNFYNSVYDYITGGTVFKYSSLIDELKKIYHIEENIIQPQYEVYNKLGYQSCFSLDNEEYLKTTKKMLDYAYKGSYDITLYLTIFHFATRFSNPLNFNLDRLEKAIIKGMMKGKKNYKHNHSLDFHLSLSSDTEHLDNIKRIRKAALDLNNEILSDTKTEESSELEKLCYDNFEEFYKKVLDRQQSFYFDPIFSKFNADSFYSLFYNSEPSKRWEIVRFFSSRYVDYPSSQLKQDIPFLQKLKDRAERKSKQLSGKNVTGFVYSELVKYLQIGIDRLNATTH